VTVFLTFYEIINLKEREFPAETKFPLVVNLIGEANKDETVRKSLIEKTGRDHITFIL
jgi:hypothetical protein